KDQHAAAFLRQRLEHRLLHPRLDELAGLRRPSPADIHREHAALAAHHRRFAEQRRQNKTALARLVLDSLGVALEPEALFDVHIKRIHEYKRQLLNLLHTVALY
ncbi:glycogen/starch/alpha-glucan phosphorylase, partial [Pseudomonas putida]|uniref:glycogen/starch/alpha-glucan phosphorylase n=1 Tax=Pseudomonas putida TaxID=303 RepID=UPI003525DA63